MFEFIKGLDTLKQLMDTEEGRKVLAHPKIQTLLENEDFKQAIQEKDIAKLVNHPEFMELTQDLEFRELLAKIKQK